MHELNEVKLTGAISKIYPRVTTPVGLSVSRFVLEHDSMQLEAGIMRKVNCKIFCIFTAQKIDQEMLDCRVSVIGFLSTNAQKELVLHITHIQNLD